MSWTMTPIAEIGKIYDGPHATPRRLERGEKYFLNISSLEGGRLDLAHSDFVSDEDFAQWTRRVTPRADDFLFSYETRLGDAALMPDGIQACLGRRMALIRPDQRRIDPRFLLYTWRSPAFREQLAAKSIHGATVDRIPLKELGNWTITLPDMATQQAIGEVLGALDDKIAANFGTSECAEHLQGALWQKARSQVSLQPLPRFVTPKLGGTPPRTDAASWEGTVPWASVRDMTSAPGRVILTTAENISHEASESAPRLQAHPVGSVFISARGTVGHVTTNAVPCAINQSAYAFTPLEKYRVSCRLALQDAVATLRAHAHGSVFNTITTKNLTGLVIPDLESSAIAEAEPDLARLEALRIAALSENTTLTAVRDELLPQLMSGRITVKDAEKRVEEEI